MSVHKYLETVYLMREECGIPGSFFGPKYADRIEALSEYAVYRYPRYRKQGLSPIAALEACEAFDRNMAEQKDRRSDHGVG